METRHDERQLPDIGCGRRAGVCLANPEEHVGT